MTTVYATVFQVPLNRDETSPTPEAVIVTDGVRITVVGNSNTARGIAAMARRRFVPGEPEEALWQFCRRALSSYEALGDRIRADTSLDAVVQQIQETRQLA